MGRASGLGLRSDISADGTMEAGSRIWGDEMNFSLLSRRCSWLAGDSGATDRSAAYTVSIWIVLVLAATSSTFPLRLVQKFTRRLRGDAPICSDAIRSVEVRDHLDRADDAGVQRVEVFGGDPVFRDGLAAQGSWVPASRVTGSPALSTSWLSV